MKLTSKIIIGFLLAIFISSIVFIVGFSFTDRVNYERKSSSIILHHFPQDKISAIDVNPYRTIVLKEKEENFSHPQETDKHIYVAHRMIDSSTSGLFIQKPSSAADENKLFIPDELRPFIDVKSTNDTLTITIKTSDMEQKSLEMAKLESGKDKHIFFFNTCLRLHTSHIDVINSLYDFPVDIKGVETDSCKVFAQYSEIRIDSCSFDVYLPTYFRDLKITNSRIREATIDFDMTQGSWNIGDNCQVGIEIFTGSSNHSISMGHEAREVNWIPKNKDAKLNIQLSGDAAKFKFLP
ncbi:MAG: hypothetical protein LBT35_07000 [Tannerella sp.]|jgi:hypothetical protein|nr:hypothetical protein [Tannerella sp.]